MPQPPVSDLHELVRVRYFAGQTLTEADLTAEQDYHRHRARRHNRLLHGVGVVDGLGVRTSGNAVVVSPGMAIDALGEECVVAAECRLVLGARGASTSQFLVLRFQEVLSVPVVAASAESGVQFSRVVEQCSVSLEPLAPLKQDPGLAIARLLWRANKWRVDSRFRRLRVK